MLDINLFRTGLRLFAASPLHPLSSKSMHGCVIGSSCSAEKGGDPELVRESQRRRYADISLVDKVVELDRQWRDGALFLTHTACAIEIDELRPRVLHAPMQVI